MSDFSVSDSLFRYANNGRYVVASKVLVTFECQAPDGKHWKSSVNYRGSIPDAEGRGPAPFEIASNPPEARMGLLNVLMEGLYNNINAANDLLDKMQKDGIGDGKPITMEEMSKEITQSWLKGTGN